MSHCGLLSEEERIWRNYTLQWVQNKAERGAWFSVQAKRPRASPVVQETSCPPGGPNLVGRQDKAVWSWSCHGLRGSRKCWEIRGEWEGIEGGGKRDWLEVGRAWLSLSRKKVMKMRPDDRALCPAEDSDLDPVVCGETDPAAEPREEGPRGQLTS